jgi:hypothetical protein
MSSKKSKPSGEDKKDTPANASSEREDTGMSVEL